MTQQGDVGLHTTAFGRGFRRFVPAAPYPPFFFPPFYPYPFSFQPYFAPFYPFQPLPFARGVFSPFPALPTASIFPFAVTRTVTLAGSPYEHLFGGDAPAQGDGSLGQRPVETANGTQRLTTEFRNYAVGVIASMHAAQGLEPPDPTVTASPEIFTGYTMYTAEAFRSRFGAADMPAQGFPPALPGNTIIANVDDLLRFGQNQGTSIRIVVATDAAEAS